MEQGGEEPFFWDLTYLHGERAYHPPQLVFFIVCLNSGYGVVCSIMLGRLDFKSVFIFIIYLFCVFVYVWGGGGRG